MSGFDSNDCDFFPSSFSVTEKRNQNKQKKLALNLRPVVALWSNSVQLRGR